MGKQPESFYGDRTKAEQFIEEVQGYLRLNADVAGLNSPRNKIAFTLTCMKGSEVAGWTKSIGQMLDTLNPDQNIPLLWDHFVQEFDRQYLDSTRENRARNELETLLMKENDIDAYIAKFEELSRQANYTIGNEQSVQLFERGLSRPVLADCVRAPPVHGYNAIKERAIHSAAAQKILDNRFGRTGNNQNKPSAGNRNYFRPFLTNYNQRQTTYSAPQRQNQQYNSSNAPPAYNNQPVAMDLGQTKFRQWRGRGNGPRGNWRNQNRGGGRANVANAAPTGNNDCFKCGRPGHYARNCPQNQGRSARANLIDFDQDDETYNEENTSRVARIHSELDAMTFAEKQQLAKDLGPGEDQDFPTA
jgi:hypothetical protein